MELKNVNPNSDIIVPSYLINFNLFFANCENCENWIQKQKLHVV
jgi:hypothetical protein